jgi:hypothetical protein
VQKGAAWSLLAYAAFAVWFLGACGLSAEGLGPPDDGGPPADATAVAPSAEGGAGADAPSGTQPPEAGPGPDAIPPQEGGGACANTTASCGSPGKCVDCTSSSQGTACVGGACGCNGPNDCPPHLACQPNHLCAAACTGPDQCNGGCCSAATCIAFDNEHCGGPCLPCGGLTPTCGTDGACHGTCGGPQDGTCQGSCCNAGTCALVGDNSCGDYGQSCTDCASGDAGTKCMLIGGNSVCGCQGPLNQDQCPTGMACYMNHCGQACDGQHPCNGGCCSGNDIHMDTCQPQCRNGQQCIGGFCQNGP